MAEYTLSQAADADFTEIYIYTFRHFGEAQADAYTTKLEACLTTLAASPDMGRSIPDIHARALRYIHHSHAVYYTRTDSGIYVLRILHHKQDVGV